VFLSLFLRHNQLTTVYATIVLSDASMASNTGPENVQPQPAVHIAQPHEFKTEFHPHSGREPLLQAFKEFGVASETLKEPPADEAPWRLFCSWGDFEFSEIALEAALNQGQVDKLLSLIMRIAQGNTHITLKNEADLHMALDNAAAELTPVCLLFFCITRYSSDCLDCCLLVHQT
jgi:hypothetical protein